MADTWGVYQLNRNLPYEYVSGSMVLSLTGQQFEIDIKNEWLENVKKNAWCSQLWTLFVKIDDPMHLSQYLLPSVDSMSNPFQNIQGKWPLRQCLMVFR